MGSNAEVYVFDHKKYVNEVVPAARRLLLSGEIEPWLNSTFEKYTRGRDDLKRALQSMRNIDLERYCTYLTSQLGLQKLPQLSQGNSRPSSWDWEARACKSESCPVNMSCPFNENMSSAVVEVLQNGIVRAMESYLGDSQFVGRSMSAADYMELLDDLNVSSGHSVREQLRKLAARGLVIGYLWGSGEGIHGWLDPEETVQLAVSLSELPLPQYEPDFEAMSLLLHQSQELSKRELDNKEVRKRIIYSERTGSNVAIGMLSPQDEVKRIERHKQWLRLSLSFVRTIATMAQKENKGILWGNDIKLRFPS